MGFFFSDESKTIKHKDIKQILNKVEHLNEAHKNYLVGKFDEHEGGNITKREVEKIVRDLKTDTADGIDHQKADRIHEALLHHLGEGPEEGDND